MNISRNKVDYWQGAAGRSLGSFEQLTIARPFRYNMATQKWSRLIKPIVTGLPFGYVEVDLTFDEVRLCFPCKIVVHTQKPTRNDKYMSSLPEYEVKNMIARARNEDFIKWVLYDDLWEGVDVTRLQDLLRYPRRPESLELGSVMRPECTFDNKPTLM